MDISTIWNQSLGIGDWVIDKTTGLAEGDDLATAVLISVFTDAAAAPEELPAGSQPDRRGWWGGPIGSKLWLRRRDKPTETLLALVKADVEQALAWLIEDGVAASIDVLTEYTRPAMLGVQITVHRRTGGALAMRFSRLWETE